MNNEFSSQSTVQDPGNTAAQQRPDLDAILNQANASRYFCNKCGYFGSEKVHGTVHRSLGSTADIRLCPYHAAESDHAKDTDALIAYARDLEATLRTEREQLCADHKNDLPHVRGCLFCGLMKAVQERIEKDRLLTTEREQHAREVERLRRWIEAKSGYRYFWERELPRDFQITCERCAFLATPPTEVTPAEVSDPKKAWRDCVKAEVAEGIYDADDPQPQAQEPSEMERKALAFDFLERSYPFLTEQDASDIINRHVFRGQVYDSALLAAEAAIQREQEQAAAKEITDGQ